MIYLIMNLHLYCLFFSSFEGMHRKNAEFNGSFAAVASRQIRICCNEGDRAVAVR